MKKKTRIRKHRKDYNHGKNGWVGGNPHYQRKNPTHKRSMKAIGDR